MKAAILDSFKPYGIDIDAKLRPLIDKDDHVFVVLDDDPTGTQTVHDVKVYTDWSYELMKEAFEKEKLFYLLTNSRAMSAAQSKKVHEQICEVIAKVSKETGRKFLFISRADSTLRGHYPLETDVLADGLKAYYGKVDGQILLPFFKEGDRYTIDDVHYVRYGDELIPCGETEFAKDRTFGYSSSDLKGYIEEKTEGLIKKEDVVSISLDQLRDFDIEGLTAKLLEAKDSKAIIVNAVSEDDVKVFCIALYKAMAQGKIFIFRSAAALVKCIGGISDRKLLQKDEMINGADHNGGLILVGSHTEKTTRQLQKLLELEKTAPLEFRCSTINESSEAFEAEIERCLAFEERTILEGRTPVIYTERVLLEKEGESKEEALARSVRISEGVWNLAARLKVRPAFVIAKGGITSADVGVKGLNITKALVLGQIQPGVPVWKADEKSRFPDIPYVIFPGNVGDDDTLKKAAEILL